MLSQEDNALISSYKLMIDKLFKTQQQQKLINLFNYIFETDIIYKTLFEPFKRHLHDIKE